MPYASNPKFESFLMFFFFAYISTSIISEILPFDIAVWIILCIWVFSISGYIYVLIKWF